MISSENLPSNNNTNDEDFTLENYRELLKLAKFGWAILDYKNIDWGQKFILWRHDIDYSLNCSLKLAKIEYEEGVKATYFVNPHSEFYNLAEVTQHNIIKEILSLGHDLGLHFDAGFHDVKSESDLNNIIAMEAAYLKDSFGVMPSAFSFHNPVSENLECEEDEYAGLKNCYSQRFKNDVSYCSDSNGYWRFRRLSEVLKKREDIRLQVLTHPGWWQEKPAPPRQRIFRSAYGRAAATMQMYDQRMEKLLRLNNEGEAQALRVIKELNPTEFELCDFLWCRGSFKTLFLKLWCLCESQIIHLCKAFLRDTWQTPPSEIDNFFGDERLIVEGWFLFDTLFDGKWNEVVRSPASKHEFWIKTRNQLIYERSSVVSQDLEKGCVYLCSIIQKLVEWGRIQDLNHDGLIDSYSIAFQPIIKGHKDSKVSEFERLKQMPEEFYQKWLIFNKKIKSTRHNNADSTLR